jgi:hypothetical protein
MENDRLVGAKKAAEKTKILPPGVRALLVLGEMVGSRTLSRSKAVQIVEILVQEGVVEGPRSGEDKVARLLDKLNAPTTSAGPPALPNKKVLVDAPTEGESLISAPAAPSNFLSANRSVEAIGMYRMTAWYNKTHNSKTGQVSQNTLAKKVKILAQQIGLLDANFKPTSKEVQETTLSRAVEEDGKVIRKDVRQGFLLYGPDAIKKIREHIVAQLK